LKISEAIIIIVISIFFAGVVQSQSLDVNLYSDYKFLYSNGRYLGIIKNGGEVKYGIIALGADTRNISGHGKSSDNTYKSTGNALSISFDIIPVENNDLGLQLQFERRRINYAEIESGPPSSYLYIKTPDYTDNGFTAVLLKKNNNSEIYLLASLYSMDEHNSEIGTAEKLSIGLRKKLSKKLFIDARIDGYRDEYKNNIHYSQCLSGTIGYNATSNCRLILNGEIYTRGIPIAGSDLSSVSAVGGLFDNSKVHTNLSGVAGVKLIYNF
jgi:hypothetical protein